MTWVISALLLCGAVATILLDDRNIITEKTLCATFYILLAGGILRRRARADREKTTSAPNAATPPSGTKTALLMLAAAVIITLAAYIRVAYIGFSDPDDIWVHSYFNYYCSLGWGQGFARFIREIFTPHLGTAPVQSQFFQQANSFIFLMILWELGGGERSAFVLTALSFIGLLLLIFWLTLIMFNDRRVAGGAALLFALSPRLFELPVAVSHIQWTHTAAAVVLAVIGFTKYLGAGGRSHLALCYLGAVLSLGDRNFLVPLALIMLAAAISPPGDAGVGARKRLPPVGIVSLLTAVHFALIIIPALRHKIYNEAIDNSIAGYGEVIASFFYNAPTALLDTLGYSGRAAGVLSALAAAALCLPLYHRLAGNGGNRSKAAAFCLLSALIAFAPLAIVAEPFYPDDERHLIVPYSFLAPALAYGLLSGEQERRERVLTVTFIAVACLFAVTRLLKYDSALDAAEKRVSTAVQAAALKERAKEHRLVFVNTGAPNDIWQNLMVSGLPPAAERRRELYGLEHVIACRTRSDTAPLSCRRTLLASWSPEAERLVAGWAGSWLEWYATGRNIADCRYQGGGGAPLVRCNITGGTIELRGDVSDWTDIREINKQFIYEK